MVFDDGKLKEECGVFGIFADSESVAYDSYLGLFALQHRGQESAGIVVGDGKDMEVKRGMGLVTEVFGSGLPLLKGNKAIGHVRYSTAGASVAINTQPLYGKFSGGNLALAHNGNLTNVASLRKSLAKDGALFYTTMDSEVIVNLIAGSKKETIEDKVIEAMNKIEGAFCLVILTDDKLIAVRDKFGFHPLCIGKLESGYVAASESCALDAIGAGFVRDMKPGEVVVFDSPQGEFKSFSYCDEKTIKKAHCIFEYIYFARTDSVIDGQSVYFSRVEMGRQLARENKDLIDKLDVVISVPDSGTPAAVGFALESGVPFLEGLNKNRYVGRTFIQPTQQKRDVAVKMKLNPVRAVVEGKSVAIIDDSIVRGTTSGKILNLLTQAGAKEVHMLIVSPPILHPCYYGIDTAVRKELIAATHSIEEIREYIGASSLRFISKEGLEKSMISLNPSDMCYACFDASYPVLPDCIVYEPGVIFAKSDSCCKLKEE